MPNTTDYRFGDLVLVPFPFTDQTGIKKRPAVVVSRGLPPAAARYFDGIFQRLRVTPGPHDITLRLPGFQTWSIEVYATPDRTINVHHDMIAGPSGPVDGDQPYEERGYSDGYGYDGP
jgi:hypothetical protein